MAADGVDTVDTTTVPDVELPHGLSTNRCPVEGGSGVGGSGNVQAVGSEARQAVGDDAVDDPVAIAKSVGRAVLTYTEGVAGSGLQAGEGVGIASDVDVGGGPVGGYALLDVDLIGASAVAIPCDGGGLVGVVDASDDGFMTDGR